MLISLTGKYARQKSFKIFLKAFQCHKQVNAMLISLTGKYARQKSFKTLKEKF